MDVSAIIAEWGAVYRPGSQGMKDLLVTLMQKSVTEGLFPVRITDATIMEKAVAEFSRVLQRFQKAWTPVGGVTLTPQKIALYKLKIDVAETPDDLEESWLGFLADNDLDRKAWPFVKWWLTNILAKAAEDMEMHEIFWGVPGTITPGTATAQGASMLGIRKQLNDNITAGTTVPVEMGAVPTDPVEFVEYIEAFRKSIPKIIVSQCDKIVMNEELAERFSDGMEEKYNKNYKQENNIMKIKNSNMQIVGVPSHNGSTKIWTTPAWNRQRGLKKPKNQNIFKLENVDRTVKAYTDYYKGVGFWIPQYIYTTDVDLAA